MEDVVKLDERGWVGALSLAELWEGGMVGLRIGDADVLLINLGDDGIHAYDNHCPHARARLSEGQLSRAKLQCPVHHWEFDARTGAGINPRSCQLRSYPVKLDGDVVMV